MERGAVVVGALDTLLGPEGSGPRNRGRPGWLRVQPPGRAFRGWALFLLGVDPPDAAAGWSWRGWVPVVC